MQLQPSGLMMCPMCCRAGAAWAAASISVKAIANNACMRNSFRVIANDAIGRILGNGKGPGYVRRRLTDAHPLAGIRRVRVHVRGCSGAWWLAPFLV